MRLLTLSADPNYQINSWLNNLLGTLICDEPFVNWLIRGSVDLDFG